MKPDKAYKSEDKKLLAASLMLSADCGKPKCEFTLCFTKKYWLEKNLELFTKVKHFTKVFSNFIQS